MTAGLQDDRQRILDEYMKDIRYNARFIDSTFCPVYIVYIRYIARAPDGPAATETQDQSAERGFP